MGVFGFFFFIYTYIAYKVALYVVSIIAQFHAEKLINKLGWNNGTPVRTVLFLHCELFETTIFEISTPFNSEIKTIFIRWIPYIHIYPNSNITILTIYIFTHKMNALSTNTQI